MIAVIPTIAFSPGALEITLCGIVIIIPLIIIVSIIKFTKKSDKEDKSAPPKIGNINELTKTIMIKCNCNHCGQRIEFDDSMVGVEVACPSCGKDTELFLPEGVVPELFSPPELTAPSPPTPYIQMGNAAAPTGNSDPAKGLGIASMILGICSITIVPCLTPIPAIICGHKSRKKSKQSNTSPSGMALAGLITGYLGLIPFIIGSFIILGAIAAPNFSNMRKDSQKTACHAQLKQIDGSKEMWATQEKRSDGDTPSKSQLGLYFEDGMPTCPGGGSYSIAPVGTDATCSVHAKLGR